MEGEYALVSSATVPSKIMKDQYIAVYMTDLATPMGPGCARPVDAGFGGVSDSGRGGFEE